MSADNYKHIQADELRELCAFKDRTIEILQDVIANIKFKAGPTTRPPKYCQVDFGDGKPYTYLCGGLYLRPGDKVIVPVGRHHHERSATVVTLHNIDPDPSIVCKYVHRKDNINV